MSPQAADRAVEYPLRDLLGAQGGLRRMPAPAYHLPDPLDPGDLPGRETPALLLEGMPLGGPGQPDLPPDAVGPLWLQGISLGPADPLRLPSNPGGGPLVDLVLLGPDSTRAASAFRATRGTGGVFTEEFMFVRPSGPGLLRAGYQDAKSEGRFASRYLEQFAENLLARYDRGTSWGGWRVGWSRQVARIRPLWYERYAFHRSATEAGLHARHRGWSGDLSLAMSWDRQFWDGSPAASRKEANARGLLRVEGPGERLRPLATLQLDRRRLRFTHEDPGALRTDVTDLGPGFAAGVEGASAGWRYRGSAGVGSPVPGKSGLTAAFDLSRGLTGVGWFALHADRTPRAPLVPRLAGDLATLIGQGVWLADSAGVALIDPSRRLEALTRVEVELLRRQAGGTVDLAAPGATDSDQPRGFYTAGLSTVPVNELRLRLRAVRIDHAVVPEGTEAALLVPASWGAISAAARDRTIRVASARLSGCRQLGAGFALEGGVAVRRSDPGWRDHLWMTPVEGCARLSCGARLFDGDLELEGFVRGELAGRRGTPYGALPASDRYDAGVIARVESVTFTLLAINLEDDDTAAADWDETSGWITLPWRSYRMGLTWRFTD